MQKFLLLIFIFCIYASLAHGKEIPMVQIKDLVQDKPYFLQPYSQIYIDYSDKKSIKDIIQPLVQSEFKPLDVNSLDKNANAYWLRYKFHNLNQDSLPIALFSMGLEHISIYLLPISQESLLSEQSDVQAITKRSYKKYRDLIYISIPSGESFVYLHLQVEQSTYRNLIGAALRSFSFYRGDYQTFWTKNKESIYIFTLLFFGALGMMFFYNMVLFFTLWDKSYLFYILYLLFYGVRVFVERDFYNDWIAPDPPKYGLLISLLSPLLFTLFQLLFTQSFLEIKHFLAWANRLTKWLVFLIIVNLFLIFLNKFVYFYQLFEFTILLSNVVMLLIAIIVAYKQRKTTTYFYLLGISFLILSTIIYIQVPANEYTIYTFNIALLGALVEMGLFSLGLANKINEVKKALIEQKLAQSHEKAAFIEEKNRELESKVNQRTLELRESNATKDKLFSIISHDLRSPLNTLKGMLAALESDILSTKEIQEIAKDIQKRLDSTDTTLNDLLQWATSQMEGASLKKEVIDIQELIDKKIELFSFIAQNKQVKLYNEVTENISVYADLNHVKVILRNLIANALKFTHVHGNITISARQEIKDFVTIAVKDTGIGMTTAQSQKLFESNTLYTTRGTQNEKGTGLGLLLCKDFVEKNGGKIWVESEYGKGSTFYFTLPSSSPIH